jgi:hypothetical protein
VFPGVIPYLYQSDLLLLEELKTALAEQVEPYYDWDYMLIWFQLTHCLLRLGFVQ